MSYNITIKCSCGKYEARFPDTDAALAETAAKMHVLLGVDHKVTATRPAHKEEGSIPVIMWTCTRDPKSS